MRLWSIHPKYLDAKGLVALWREGLLAQKVLLNLTKGYTNHPQLKRFKETVSPLESITAYLLGIIAESDKRGYSFDKCKIHKKHVRAVITVTLGQVSYEFDHLLAKLEIRDPGLYQKLLQVKEINAHPLFKIVDGPVESWEKRIKKNTGSVQKTGTMCGFEALTQPGEG